MLYKCNIVHLDRTIERSNDRTNEWTNIQMKNNNEREREKSIEFYKLRVTKNKEQYNKSAVHSIALNGCQLARVVKEKCSIGPDINVMCCML